jgi:hypothetical protein
MYTFPGRISWYVIPPCRNSLEQNLGFYFTQPGVAIFISDNILVNVVIPNKIKGVFPATRPSLYIPGNPSICIAVYNNTIQFSSYPRPNRNYSAISANSNETRTPLVAIMRRNLQQNAAHC